MAEKPILFSTEMVKAILDGRKTQTRRVMKPQPEPFPPGWFYNGEYYADDSQMQSHLFHDVYGDKGSPYGSVYANGDTDMLWVRETWQAQNTNGQWWHEVPKEERDLHNWAFLDKATPDSDLPVPPKWIPSIFMPRWASRITLQVTAIRVERVQDISKRDAMREGIVWSEAFPEGYHVPGIKLCSMSAELMFMKLWDSINVKRGYSWNSNPWVWVIEFKVAN